MEKEFTCGNTTITRGDYENMPCPMNTSSLTDEDMQELADRIEYEMSEYQELLKDKTITEDEYETQWWRVMEDLALDFGMTYYEDYN